MRLLTVRHVTIYSYSEPVGLGEHRMMFRPRESHDLRLIKTRLNIMPKPKHLRWLHDVFDNSVAIATFSGRTSELRFESTVTLEHVETALPDYALDPDAKTYPFAYPSDDRPDLTRALKRHCPATDVDHWAASFLAPSGSTGTIALLRSMTLGIREQFVYSRRIERGRADPKRDASARSRNLSRLCLAHDRRRPISWPRGPLRERLHLCARCRPCPHCRRRGNPCLAAGLPAGSGLG